jgi:hypothetical protein
VIAEPGAGIPDAFELRRLRRFAAVAVGADGREHLALSDGFRRVRIDIVAGTLLDGPVRLIHQITGLTSARPAILSLRRLIALHECRAFSRRLYPRERPATRIVAALRVHDALACGASQREIAQGLFGDDVAWPGPGESVKSSVRRLIALAERLSGDGYRTLLRGGPSKEKD